MTYSTFFNLLTHRAPFPYQARLAVEPWPTLLDIPTGLGKTAAVTIAWLYKRLHGDPNTGRRLVYCLPMRVLVEQTASTAREWCSKAAGPFAEKGLEVPTVHLLMGGDLDEDWENTPERPAILIGTQDMLLSRALNRGYAMSRYKWPVHFGLLNSDCLWVFDETQLIGVGIETSAQLQGLRSKLGVHNSVHSLWMSATLGERQLATVDHPRPAQGWRLHGLRADDHETDIVQARVGAKKPIQRLDEARLGVASEHGAYVDALVARAISEHSKRRGLTLVIVNRVQRAQAIYEALLETGQRNENDTALIHSRFRGNDRTRHEAVLLAIDADRIVVATQAVEAGVDVSARTMFTELAPWSSLVQRFGRCNRYGGDESGIFWADIDTSDVKNSLALPYEATELDMARQLLEGLEVASGDAGPESLKRIDYDPPSVIRPVLRRRDLVDLFDTTPDLSGNDIDISRYVRDGEDTDVQVYWRAFEEHPRESFTPPDRNELCRVSIAAARDFIAKLDKKRQANQTRSVRYCAWRWDPLDNEWKATAARQVYSGQVLLLHSDAGGYNPQLGWTGEAASKVPTPPTTGESEMTNADDAYDGDPGTVLPSGRWVLLVDHLGHVQYESKALAQALGLGEFIEALATAGLWHDVGKAHEVFQRKLLAPLDQCPELRPDSEGVWAKSSHRLKSPEDRKHFRHELASALAWLAAGGGTESRFTDLVAYLVAAHHGKVRLSIRSLPGESEPDTPTRLFARGVWDREVLPPFDLPDGRRFDGVTLDLSVMQMGRGSWLERALALRDDVGIGPFRLALFESVLRIADWRASRKEEEGAYEKEGACDE